jgi:flagellum-specific peptidoglycan hydrolase FlgJ
MSNPILKQEWIDAAQAAHKTFYPEGPFTSVTLAQFGLESGWGRYASGKNNYFGIKATPEQIKSGKATPRWTREERSDGTPYSIVAYFADYDSLAEGFTAHAALLVQPWYKDCIDAGTVEEYCLGLQKDHYATDVHYAEKLMEIINSMNLKQYDIGVDQ